jgi:perosamine synthetase
VIQVSNVALGPAEEGLVLQVLRSGQLAQGPQVARLEELFAELCGVDHAVAVSSGTTALVAAIEALQPEPGDELVTSPFTFVATVNAALEAGLSVRFADIDAETFCVERPALEEVVGERTRILMPVHLYGQAADMDAVVDLATRHGSSIVEDAAQAHGAEFGGRRVGSFGLGCFSLYATKNVTTGEGGVVTTDDDRLADRLRLLRNQGMRARYDYALAGHNWRLTDLQAAVGIPQLERLQARTEDRRRNAAMLTQLLVGIDGLALPSEAEGRRHVWHQYTVRVTSAARLTRDELMGALRSQGVGSGVYYPRACYDYPCYREDPRVIIDELPVVEQVAGEVLSLPVHPQLSDGDLETIAGAVRSALA